MLKTDALKSYLVMPTPHELKLVSLHNTCLSVDSVRSPQTVSVKKTAYLKIDNDMM